MNEDKVYVKLISNDEINQKKEKRKKRLKSIAVVLAIILAFVAGFLTRNLIRRVVVKTNNYETLDEIRAYLDNFWLYGDDYEDLDSYLVDEAYRGMTDFEFDPYTTYMSSEELNEYSSSINMDYVGVGVQYTLINERAVVTKVFLNSPAYIAGIEEGDIIVGVNNEKVDDLDSEEIKEKVIGKEGTNVIINVLRGNEELAIEVTRGKVDSSAYGKAEDDYIYLEILSFGQNTGKEVMKYLNEYPDIKNIIIDLRDNGGGYQTSVQELAGLFIGNNQVYMRQKDKYGNETLDYTTCTKTYDFEKIIILTNGNTASASEVFTICLKEYLDNVTVLGETTFGKGIMQSTVLLSNNGALKYTSYEWTSPDGVSINKVGISPDIEVKQHPLSYKYYEQLDEGITYEIDSVSNYISLVQECLNMLGYKVDRMDGYFETSTFNALKDYQKDHNLNADGIINKETYDAIINESIKELYINQDLDYQLLEAISLIK